MRVIVLLAAYRLLAISSAFIFIWIYVNKVQTHVAELCLSAVWCGSFQRMIALQLYLNYCWILYLKCVPIHSCSVLIWSRRLAGCKSNVISMVLLGMWFALIQMRHPIIWGLCAHGKQVMWRCIIVSKISNSLTKILRLISWELEYIIWYK